MNKSGLKYDDLIGIPYMENGRTLKGFDCYGLCIEVNRRLGNELPDLMMKDIGRDYIKSARILFAKINYDARSGPSKMLVPGDIVLFRSLIGNERHVGVIVEPGKFLHATKDGGQVWRTNLNHPFFRHRIQAFYRVK